MNHSIIKCVGDTDGQLQSAETFCYHAGQVAQEQICWSVGMLISTAHLNISSLLCLQQHLPGGLVVNDGSLCELPCMSVMLYLPFGEQ